MHTTQWLSQSGKGSLLYMLYGFNCLTSWEWTNYGDSKKMRGWPEAGDGKDDKKEHRGS